MEAQYQLTGARILKDCDFAVMQGHPEWICEFLGYPAADIKALLRAAATIASREVLGAQSLRPQDFSVVSTFGMSWGRKIGAQRKIRLILPPYLN